LLHIQRAILPYHHAHKIVDYRYESIILFLFTIAVPGHFTIGVVAYPCFPRVQYFAFGHTECDIHASGCDMATMKP